MSVFFSGAVLTPSMSPWAYMSLDLAQSAGLPQAERWQGVTESHKRAQSFAGRNLMFMVGFLLL